MAVIPIGGESYGTAEINKNIVGGHVLGQPR